MTSLKALPVWPLVAFVALGAAAACNKDKTTQKAEAVAPAPAPAPVVVGEVAEGHGFKVTMRPGPGQYKVGETGAVEIVLNSRSGFKCNEQYPYKFVAAESSGLTFPKQTVKKEGMALAEAESVMTVPVVPDAAGHPVVEGVFHFSVCNEETCLVEKKKLALTLDVH